MDSYQNRWKRFMETILSHFPNHLEKYTPEERVLLNEFVNILQNYTVDTGERRDRLISSFNQYIEKHKPTQTYYNTPFLWLTISYFENASQLLNASGFHANQFYEYLVKHLKKIFRLVKEGVDLSDLGWEGLQYDCYKLIVPLTDEEFQILQIIYSLIKNSGIKALNFNHIKTTISHQMKKPNISRILNRFFTRIDAYWYLQFNPTTFGLERLFFHFQLKESISLSDIIDFQNSVNTTLCASNIYQIRNFPNMYTGFLLIPSYCLKELKDYLQQKERQGDLFIHTLSQITDSRISGSLALYKVGEGWSTLSQHKLGILRNRLTTSRPRERKGKQESIHPSLLMDPYDQTWHYSWHPHPNQVISLICKIPRAFTVKDLSRRFSIKQTNNTISISESNLLKELFRKQVARITFFPNRMIYEFSLDDYWVEVSPIPYKQLLRLLYWLPTVHLFLMDKNIQMWTKLTPNLAEWLRNDLNWSVKEIIQYKSPSRLLKTFYNEETSQWKTPSILKSDN